MCHTRDRHTQSGFSLTELAIAATLLLALVWVITTLALSGSASQELGRRIARMTDIAQEVTDKVRLEMVTSVRVFGDNGEGNANLALLDLSTSPAPATRRLPLLDIDGELGPDQGGEEKTGNALFFAYLAWRDRFRTSTGTDHLVDVYRWVHYYLSPVDGGPAPDRRGGLEMVRFVSEPLADGHAVDDILDPAERAEVLLHLVRGTADVDGQVHDPVAVVWRRGGDPNVPGTLRQIDDGDGALSDDPLAGRPDPWAILPAEEGAAGLLHYRRAQVVSNFETVAPGVSRFAIRDDAVGFPHGFEVQIVGPTSARQVLFHIVLTDTSSRGQPAWSQMQTVMVAHDR